MDRATLCKRDPLAYWCVRGILPSKRSISPSAVLPLLGPSPPILVCRLLQVPGPFRLLSAYVTISSTLSAGASHLDLRNWYNGNPEDQCPRCLVQPLPMHGVRMEELLLENPSILTPSVPACIGACGVEAGLPPLSLSFLSPSLFHAPPSE